MRLDETLWLSLVTSQGKMRLVSYTPLAPGQRSFTSTCFDRAVDICRWRSCANCCSIPALAELDTALLRCSLSSTLQVLRSKCSTYMAVRTRSGRRSGATPLNGGADHAPYEWKLDALLTVVYLAVLYYWR